MVILIVIVINYCALGMGNRHFGSCDFQVFQRRLNILSWSNRDRNIDDLNESFCVFWGAPLLLFEVEERQSDLEQLLLAVECRVGEAVSSLSVFLVDELSSLFRWGVAVQLLRQRQPSPPEIIGPVVPQHDEQLTNKQTWLSALFRVQYVTAVLWIVARTAGSGVSGDGPVLVSPGRSRCSTRWCPVSDSEPSRPSSPDLCAALQRHTETDRWTQGWRTVSDPVVSSRHTLFLTKTLQH